MFYALVMLAAASRFLPHPPNVALVGALGLFAGCYAKGWAAYLVPVAAMLLSDAIGHAIGFPGLGFYNASAMAFVYAGLVLSVPIGRQLSDRRRWGRLPVATVISSTLFFLLSNFGVWLGGWYAFTLSGLLACYVNGLPFYGFTLMGDFVFAAILFGAYEFNLQRSGRRQPDPAGV